MEAFDHSCSNAKLYPCNLLDPNLPRLLLENLRLEVLRQSEDLFCDEEDASVDILEARNAGGELAFRNVRNEDDLRKVIEASIVRQTYDPACRMIFLYGPSARDPLNITLGMAQQIFTYHQVMPAFMESLFSFGFREHSQDCNSLSLRARKCFYGTSSAKQVTALGRSGRFVEHCYGLRAAERSSSQPSWPWSLRLCSTYHSIDLDTGLAVWIIVKANQLIENLVKEATSSRPDGVSPEAGGVAQAMADAFKVHELIALWCGSNWQWYIDFLDSQIQDITRPALSVTMEEKTEFESSRPIEPERKSFYPRTPFDLERQESEPKPLMRTRSTMKSIASCIRLTKKREDTIRSETIKVQTYKFSMKDIPQVHYIEEKVNESLDALQNNVEILDDLKADYNDLLVTLETIGKDVQQHKAYRNFVEVVEEVQRELRKQQRRAKSLLRLIADRKALLENILHYEAIIANQKFAEKANLSANKMENIAVKTKLETVSMRIITLVTLFFLPGTFISTLMSTSIVSFAPGSPSTSDSNISMGALAFYCAVSVPLVVFTFAVWYGVYWWEDRKEKMSKLEKGQ